MIVSVSTFVKNEVNKVRRCSRKVGTLFSENFARDDFSVHTGIALGHQNYSVKVLFVPRLTEFILCVQVDPKLEASTSDIEALGHLCMYYAFSSSHPLDIAWAYHTMVAFEVFVMDLSL